MPVSKFHTWVNLNAVKVSMRTLCDVRWWRQRQEIAANPPHHSSKSQNVTAGQDRRPTKKYHRQGSKHDTRITMRHWFISRPANIWMNVPCLFCLEPAAARECETVVPMPETGISKCSFFLSFFGHELSFGSWFTLSSADSVEGKSHPRG